MGVIDAPLDALGPEARREVLAFPAELLGDLPVAARFILQGLGITTSIVWTTVTGGIAPGRNGIVFDAEEVQALARGVQSERLWAADLKGFCLRKLHDSSFRVNDAIALGGAQPSSGPAWPLGRVLRALDLELTGLELATSVRADESGAAAA